MLLWMIAVAVLELAANHAHDVVMGRYRSPAAVRVGGPPVGLERREREIVLRHARFAVGDEVVEDLIARLALNLYAAHPFRSRKSGNSSAKLNVP